MSEQHLRYQIAVLIRELNEEKARCAELRSVFGQGEPWPLVDVLVSLRNATLHLLHDHNCDHMGHETISENTKRAQEFIDKLQHAASRDCGEVA